MPSRRASGVSCRSSVLRLAFVLLCAVAVQAEELETHWRKAKLAESGRTYWWRPSLGSDDDPEVSFTMPADAWRKGQLDDGSDYLWRMDPYGQPDVQLWRESKLDSTHEPFWYTADGQQEVRLTNPFDLAVDHDEL
mmetsp:Transcript_4752/g.11739  ORF Transcript_4752/g.11739 Transcript_4752/m.11739 type:complete len:136 (-) Transcript_4752:251-658(-)